MNVFGHVGLTLAAAYSAEYLFRYWSRRKGAVSVGARVGQGTGEDPPESPSGKEVGRTSLSLDYRLVMLGSLLPDFIDKPLALWLLPEFANYNTRNVGHTVLFAFLLLATAFAMARMGYGIRPLVLAVTSAGHLALDQMWRQPAILLWPLMGWEFPLGVVVAPGDWWLARLLNLRLLHTQVYEVVGAAIILLFAARLARRQALGRFLRKGAVS
jgi:hypothetical protein